MQISVVENLTSNDVSVGEIGVECNLFFMGSSWPTRERPIAQPISYGLSDFWACIFPGVWVPGEPPSIWPCCLPCRLMSSPSSLSPCGRWGGWGSDMTAKAAAAAGSWSGCWWERRGSRRVTTWSSRVSGTPDPPALIFPSSGCRPWILLSCWGVELWHLLSELLCQDQGVVNVLAMVDVCVYGWVCICVYMCVHSCTLLWARGKSNKSSSRLAYLFHISRWNWAEVSEAERKQLYLEIRVNILQAFRWKLKWQVTVSCAAAEGLGMEKWWRARRERQGALQWLRMAEDGGPSSRFVPMSARPGLPHSGLQVCGKCHSDLSRTIRGWLRDPDQHCSLPQVSPFLSSKPRVCIFMS